MLLRSNLSKSDERVLHRHTYLIFRSSESRDACGATVGWLIIESFSYSSSESIHSVRYTIHFITILNQVALTRPAFVRAMDPTLLSIIQTFALLISSYYSFML